MPFQFQFLLPLSEAPYFYNCDLLERMRVFSMARHDSDGFPSPCWPRRRSIWTRNCCRPGKVPLRWAGMTPRLFQEKALEPGTAGAGGPMRKPCLVKSFGCLFVRGSRSVLLSIDFE
jgi:hypothetical protein